MIAPGSVFDLIGCPKLEWAGRGCGETGEPMRGVWGGGGGGRECALPVGLDR